jgi:membrane protease YdiL (CAAX protease family)
MRAFKIILLIILAFILFMMVLGIIDVYGAFKQNSEAIYMVIVIAIGLIAAILALIYHIKSFRYYRESKRKGKDRKLPIILWIGAIVTGVYYLLFGVVAILGAIMSNAQINSNVYDITMITFMVIIALFGIFSLVETSILKKRIKQLKAECTTKDEISSIGNSTT